MFPRTVDQTDLTLLDLTFRIPYGGIPAAAHAWQIYPLHVVASPYSNPHFWCRFSH